MNSSIKAFLDEDYLITIVSNKKTSFYINGAFLPVNLVSEHPNFVYKAIQVVDVIKQSYISNDFNESCLLEIRYFAKTSDFDNLFYYDGNDLGATYHKDHTTFKLWAPIASKVILRYTLNEQTYEVEMTKGDKGVFEVDVKGDLDNALYNYVITNNGKEVTSIDPYSYSCNANGESSAVINLEKLSQNEFDLKPLNNINDAIIYELSVRDFSFDGSLGEDVKGKFTAFLKHGLKSKKNHPIGFDYIKDLGVTHVQFMPIFDFATVDETNIEAKYNWGYDPYSYNCLEGSFSSNPNDPFSRLKEAKEMIDEFHKNGLRVTLDVVFNHTYTFADSIYNKIVPNYFYLMDRNGNLSNGSFCGDDIDTSKKMTHKYFVDMCLRYVKLLQIDGLRFDLMGILTKDLVIDIYNKCKEVNPSFIMYGEGWNMPSMLAEHKRASLNNAQDIPQIAFFNDFFRDTTSGKSFGDNKTKGYLTGETSLFYKFLKGMRGSVEKECYFNCALSSINYVECHDNYTLYDKLRVTNPNNTDEERNRMQLCCIAASILACGVPFLHMGSEFNRTKFLNENSYNAKDEINKIRWESVDTYENNVKAVKDFIKIRNTFECFKLHNRKEILNSIDGQVNEDNVLSITYASKQELVMIIFNPTNKKQKIDLESEYKLYANHTGILKNDDRVYTQVKLIPYSFVILVK